MTRRLRDKLNATRLQYSWHIQGSVVMPVAMRKGTAAAIALLAGMAMAANARQPHRPEQDAAYSAKQQGDIRPFPEIRDRVAPRMGGASYLGSEFDQRSVTYRLKFMRGASVIWVDVDARTGAIIGRSGD